MVLILRSLVAPIYLLASVLLSYAAAMGFTTLFWQDLLGKGAIDWAVPIFAIVMLVAVGADDNIFLMSRVESLPHTGQPETPVPRSGRPMMQPAK